MRLSRSIVAGLGVLGATVAPPAPRAQVVEVPIVERGAVSGAPQRIGIFYEVNPDCSENGLPVVHVAQAPAHGKVQVLPLLGNTEFPAGTQQYGCNLRKLPVLALFYVSERGFQGTDAVVVSIIHPSGLRRVLRYVLTVESAPPASVRTQPDTWVHV